MLGLVSVAVAILVVLVVVAFVVYFGYKLWQMWLVIVPPNQTAVVYGTNGEPWYIRGGAKIVNQYTHRVAFLSHEPMTIPCVIKNILTKDNHAVNIVADGVVHIGLSDELVKTAASKWLGAQTLHMQAVIQQTIDGYARVVVSDMELAALRSEQQQLTQKIHDDCVPQLEGFGLTLQNFTIQSLEDAVSNGGLAMLADQQLAVVQSKVAIVKSDAQRQAAVNAADNLRQSSEAQNTTRMRVAQLESDAAAAEEKAKQSPLLTREEAQKAVIAAQVENEIARADGQNTIARNKAASDAQAEASRKKIEANAQAEVIATLAEADLTQALKEAEGIQARAEAQNTFSEQSMLMQLAPELLKALQAALQTQASSLSNASITVLDSGNGGSSTSMANLGMNIPAGKALLKAFGFDIDRLLLASLPPVSAPSTQANHNGRIEESAGLTEATTPNTVARTPVADSSSD